MSETTTSTTNPATDPRTTTDLYSELVTKFTDSLDKEIQLYQRDIKEFWNDCIKNLIAFHEKESGDRSSICFSVLIDDDEHNVVFYYSGIDVLNSSSNTIQFTEHLAPEDKKDDSHLFYSLYEIRNSTERNLIVEFLNEQDEEIQNLGFEKIIITKGFSTVLTYSLSLEAVKDDYDDEEDDCLF